MSSTGSTGALHPDPEHGGRVVYYYRHSQNATWTFWIILLIGVVSAGSVWYYTPGTPGLALTLLTLALITLVLLIMFRLTVTIDDEAIRLSYGIGIIRKAIPLDAVVSCETVRNKAWWGWGIRMFFDGISPAGWLYNVDGLDAVELEMKNGSRLRIGTDESDELHVAILRVLDGGR